MTATVDTILREHSFFQDVADRHINDVVQHAMPVSFEMGQLIFRQGESANEFYVITEGLVALEVFAPRQGPVQLMTIGAGEVLGWSWLFEPFVWHLDARALEPIQAIKLDGVALRQECDQNHELGYHLLKHAVWIIEQRLQACMLQMLDMYDK
jgi:CRP-like cAMP-binding protein